MASLVDSANRYGVPNGGIILSVDADGFLWVTNSVDDDFTMEALDPGLKRLAGISLAAVADLFARLPNRADGFPVGIRVRSLHGTVAPGSIAPGNASGGTKWFGVGVPLYQPAG
ncbi:MAG: hypothetical protein LBG60_10585 [Bifidobacteriaceae bacterium]|nr:hypothetical protein [Bifidobacteriaceae bacterium]